MVVLLIAILVVAYFAVMIAWAAVKKPRRLRSMGRFGSIGPHRHDDANAR